MKTLLPKYLSVFILLGLTACISAPDGFNAITPSFTRSVEKTMVQPVVKSITPSGTSTLLLSCIPPTAQPCPPEKFETSFGDWDNPEKSIGLYFADPNNWSDHYYKIGISYDYSDPNMLLAQLENGTKGLLWLGEFICIKNRIEYYKLLDVKPLPEKKVNEGIPWNICAIGSVGDKDVFAWGRFEVNNPQLLDIKKAWRLNVKTKKIDIISVEKVTCLVYWNN